jgi:hypothetical protein
MVPATLQAVTGSPPLGPVVRTRGGALGRRYDLTGGGARYEILFLPTGHLVGTAVCVTPARGPGLARCSQILSTLSDPHAIAPDPRAAYADFLSRTLTALSAAEQAGLQRLGGAATRSAEASAAAGIAAAFRAARAALHGLVGHGASAPELGSEDGLANQAAAVAAAYAALAAAARSGSAAAYAAAAAEVRSTRTNLGARLYELSRGNYTVAP